MTQPWGHANTDRHCVQALLTDSSRNSLTPSNSEDAPGTARVQGELGNHHSHLSKVWAEIASLGKTYF